MKKLFVSIFLFMGVTLQVNAQAIDVVPMAHTPVNRPEYNPQVHYPGQNLYDTEMYRSYWVWDKNSASWVKRVELIVPNAVMPVSNLALKPVNQENYNWITNPNFDRRNYVRRVGQ